MTVEPTNANILTAVLGLSGEVRELGRRMGGVETQLAHLSDEFAALSKAFDSDAF